MFLPLAWDHLAMMNFVCNKMDDALAAAVRAVELSVKTSPGQNTLPVAVSRVREGIVRFGMCGCWHELVVVYVYQYL